MRRCWVLDPIVADSSPTHATLERPPFGNSRADSSEVWLERPSLEYQHAFDWCAVELHRIMRPVALFASSAFYARELLKRLHGLDVSLLPLGRWYSSAEDKGRLLGPEVELADVEDLHRLQRQVEAAVWAEPERTTAEESLGCIRQALVPVGRLYVISSGWLRRFLPEWKRAGCRPSEFPAGWCRTVQSLRREGFEIEALFGFHGPASALWGLASQLLTCVHRHDLTDRCHFRMRATYVVSGWQALLAPVGVAAARKR